MSADREAPTMPMRNVLTIPALALFVWTAGTGCVRANPTQDLWRAIVAGNIAEVETLLKSGANPNARFETVPGMPEKLQGIGGVTPLFYAALQNNTALASALIEGGADPNARIKIDTSAPEEIRSLGGSGSTPLHGAAEMDSPAVIETLIKGGADPNARNDQGITPLHVAAAKNKPAAIKALIAAGADPNMRGSALLITPSGIADLLGNSAAVRAFGESELVAPATPPPAAKPTPYDGSRPPRTVAEIKVYCEQQWLEVGGWSAVKACVDRDTEAFRALHR